MGCGREQRVTAPAHAHLAQPGRGRCVARQPPLPCAPAPQAFQPLFAHACQQLPAALFLRVVAQPAEVAAAGAGATGAAAGALPRPGSCGDRAQLLHSLGIGVLPCTLLLRGGQLLSRLEWGAAGDAPSGPPAPAQPAQAAAAAVRQLQAAMLAAGVQARLQHADCAPSVPGLAFASQ